VSVSDTIVVEDILIDDSYSGPRMERDEGDAFHVTEAFVKDMMGAFKEQKALHRRFVLTILLAFQKLVKALPSLVDVDVPDGKQITVCGDTHGQYYDLLHIFERNGLPNPDNPYVFNGDFVDRGSFSVEVILTLMAWKCVHPEAVHLTRGNHEAQSLNKIYGFEGEVKAKYNMNVMAVFRCARTRTCASDMYRGMHVCVPVARCDSPEPLVQPIHTRISMRAAPALR
jgi:serine/threonine-protein phosphatase 5